MESTPVVAKNFGLFTSGELVSRQFPESFGVLVEALSKLLDHSV